MSDKDVSPRAGWRGGAGVPCPGRCPGRGADRRRPALHRGHAHTKTTQS